MKYKLENQERENRYYEKEERSVSGLSMRSSSSWGWSQRSDASDDRLSFKEVNKLKKWVAEKDREERRNNIAIKGIRDIDKITDLKEWVQEFLKEKLKVEGEVTYVRKSGSVVIAGMGNEDIKKEVMKNKNKLKGENIFIENDLSWEDRNIQSKINGWAKEQRTKEKEIKIGLGKVKIDGIWKYWNEIEKIEGEVLERESARRNEAAGATVT